jgi:hypothetical protein
MSHCERTGLLPYKNDNQGFHNHFAGPKKRREQELVRTGAPAGTDTDLSLLARQQGWTLIWCVSH